MSDWGWEVKIVLEVVLCWSGYPQCESNVKLHPVTDTLLLSPDLCSQASCLHWLGCHSTYFTPLRWRAELHISAKTTCSSVWLYESHQEKKAALFDVQTFGAIGSQVSSISEQVSSQVYSPLSNSSQDSSILEQISNPMLIRRDNSKSMPKSFKPFKTRDNQNSCISAASQVFSSSLRQIQVRCQASRILEHVSSQVSCPLSNLRPVTKSK